MMNNRHHGTGLYEKPTLTSNKKPGVGRKKSSMTPQGQNKPFCSSRISGSNEKLRQRRNFPTDYCGLIRKMQSHPPASILKAMTAADDNVFKKKDNPGPGKVKIMLRVSLDSSTVEQSNQEFLRVEGNNKHVSVFVPEEKSSRNRALAPKVYAFDSVFTEATPLNEICNTSLPDVIQAVLQGADGTVFCYGQSNLGKTHVLMGQDRTSHDIGMLPCATSWLYQCIDELKQQQGTRFSVRVSAIEVYGRSEKLRDLLAGYCEDGPSAALCVAEDPLMGMQLQNQCEIRANTAERAAYLLDAALASRSCSGSKDTPEARRHSHMVFTLHVYHHKVGDSGVSGGRSRLHFIDLGSCEKTLVKTTTSLALSLSSLGHVIMAIVNNSKHVPFKESKLTCVLRESLGNVNCRVVMLAHVSRDVAYYSDTLSTIQMASRIHRVLKKKYNPGQCSRDRPMPRSNHLRNKCRDDESVGSSSGMEFTSGSELSCDTVVYVNKKGIPLSDRELTDNEGPPEMVPVRIKAKIPPIIAEASPPEEGEMVYNIAQAKVHKLERTSNEAPKPERKGFTKSNHKNNIKKPTSSRTSSIPSPGMTNLVSKLPPRQAVRSNSLKKTSRQSSISLEEPSASSYKKQCFGYKNSSIGRANSPKAISSNTTSLTSPQTKAPNDRFQKQQNTSTTAATKLVKDSRKPAKPPRSKTRQEELLYEKKRCLERTSQRSSLPRPMTNMSGCNKGLTTPEDEAKNQTKNPKTEHKTNHTDDYVNLKSNMASHTYENVSSFSKCQDKLSTCEERNNSEITSIVNAERQTKLQEKRAIPSVQQFTKEVKMMGCDDSSFNDPLYTDMKAKEDKYPTAHDERPEPVGCAFETEQDKLGLQTKCILPIANSQHVELRPDSLFVNLDEEDWVVHGEEQSEGEDAVDVNFYCLTFTSKNPLIPMTRSKFSQQIKINKKRKSSSETSSISESQVNELHSKYENKNTVNIEEPDHTTSAEIMTLDTNTNDCAISQSYSLTRSDTFIIDKEDDKLSSEKWAWEVQDSEKAENPREDSIQGMKDLSEEDLDMCMSNIKEMPKLKCSYASDTNGSRSGTLTKKSIGMFHGSPHHEVRLYDSNSLEMSYVSTKQSFSSSFDSPSRSSNSSQSLNKKDVNKNSEVRMRTSRPVVMNKSASKEGARLTLVKKHCSGGPTLELLITDENDKNNNELLASKSPGRQRKFGISRDLSKKGKQEKISAKVTKSSSDSSTKKSKWSGLKRFSTKKSDAKPTARSFVRDEPKEKSSLVSKILNSKTRVQEDRRQQSASGRLFKCTTVENSTMHPTTVGSHDVARNNIKYSKTLSQPISREARVIEKTSVHVTPTKQSTNAGVSSSRFGFSRKAKLK